MERRKLLQLLAASGASATLGIGTSSTLQKAIATSESTSHWGYVGAGSPEHWGDLSANYSACRSGLQQSPINLHNSINATLTTLDILDQPIPLTILNNGHTIQMNSIASNFIQLDGEEFELLQFHFHHPSEHTVEGVTHSPGDSHNEAY
ncbi:MAG: carbonic anhydrase family protein [Cyanobacteria bacterium J06639_14]